MGNQLSDTAHSYAFSSENQAIQMDAGAATYEYDGEGRRAKETVNGGTTYYFYGLSGIISEFTVRNTAATMASALDRTIYLTTDRLRTAVLLLSSTGAVLENNRTLPYGEPWHAKVGSANENKFTSYHRDGESDLDYAISRYYDFAAARFRSVDSGPFLSSI